MPRAMLKSALVLYNVPTKNAAAARRFYSALLGSDDFVRTPNEEVPSYFRPLSSDGIDITLTDRQDDREATTCYFAVRNLQQTMDELQRLGGTVVVPAREVRISSTRVAQEYVAQKQREGIQANEQVGHMAVLLDPDGNHVGLMELAEHAHRHFRWGRSQRPLDRDQLDELDQLRRLRPPRRPAGAPGEDGGWEEEGAEEREGGDEYVRGIGTQLHRLIDQLVEQAGGSHEGEEPDYEGEPPPDEEETAEQAAEEQRPMSARATPEARPSSREQRPRRPQK